MYPIGFDLNGSVPLLKKDNIRNDIRTGVGAERIVGQTNGSQQFGPLSDILSGIHILGVHGVSACHEGNYAAGTNLIESLG